MRNEHETRRPMEHRHGGMPEERPPHHPPMRPEEMPPHHPPMEPEEMPPRRR